MSDPRWTDETEQLVAKALWAACFVPPRGASTTIGQPSQTCYEDARGALTALADAGWLSRVRIWHEEDSEPTDVSAVRDCDGDEYLKVEGGWRHRYAKPESEPLTWATVREYAPITEVTS